MLPPKVVTNAKFIQIPIEKNQKILAIDKDKNVQLMKIKGGREILLTLLTDTVVITEEIGTRGAKRLLFPPIPLIHLNLLQLSENVVEVQLSPYKKIHLVSSMPTDFFNILIECKDRLASEKTASSVSTPQVAEVPKEIFSSLCQPTIFKFETRQWEKLSKCNCSIYSSGNDCWVSLNIVGSMVNILSGSIKPSSTCRMDSPTRIDMVVTNQHGIPSRYLLKFPAEINVAEFVEIFDLSLCKSVIGICSQHNFKEPRVDECGLETVQMVGENMKLRIKDKNGAWVFCGPVSMRIEKYGLYQRFNRLILSSEYNAAVDFIDIEMDDFMFKSEDKGGTICFKTGHFTIKLDNINPGLQFILEQALQSARSSRLEYKTAQDAQEKERLEKEKQKLEMAMQQLALKKKEPPNQSNQAFANSLGMLESSEQALEKASQKLNGSKIPAERVKRLKNKLEKDLIKSEQKEIERPRRMVELSEQKEIERPRRMMELLEKQPMIVERNMKKYKFQEHDDARGQPVIRKSNSGSSFYDSSSEDLRLSMLLQSRAVIQRENRKLFEEVKQLVQENWELAKLHSQYKQGKAK